MSELAGKVALVTGAASGIGRAAAQLLAQRGAAVTVADVDEVGGQETVESITLDGGVAQFVPTDVADPAQVEAMVAATVDAYGRLDCALNNAGIVGAGVPVAEHPVDEWRRGIDVMLTGVFLGMKYEIPAMLASGGGTIVNTSSGAGLVGFPGMASYVAAKHGVIGLTKTAALEYAQQGIRINAICPGTARTRMVDDWLANEPEGEAMVAGLHPIGRIADAEEIAETAVWLCSDAASFVVGAAIAVDGGYSIQ